MSKQSSDPIELQRLAKTINGNMSGLDSSHTDVGGMAPLYNTVEVAQSEAQNYKDQHVQEDYTHPGHLDPLNEYDIVRDKQRENTSPGYLHQNNVLYADQFAAQEMKHATLTQSDQHRYAGPTSDEVVKETRDSCGCGNPCLWCAVVVVFCFIAALAVVAVVMAVLMIVQIIPVCNCAASPEEVQELRNMIENLSFRLNTTSTDVSVLTQRLNDFDITPAVESAIAERITDDGTIIGLNFSALLTDFEPFSDCQTSIERQCTITSVANLCETPPLYYVIDDPAKNYTRDLRCIRMPQSMDQNILTTSLVIDEHANDVFCLCYRVPIENNVRADVSCGLQVTRCRSTRNVPVNVVTTSSAFQTN